LFFGNEKIHFDSLVYLVNNYQGFKDEKNWTYLEILRFDVYPTTQTELKIYHFDKK